jgi:hypothetical protein
MTEDLTTSPRERQNILNNRYALEKAEAYLALGGIEYQGERVFTKQQVVALFEISDSTVEKYLAQHEDELKRNGYVLLRGNKLKAFKGLPDVSVINYGTTGDSGGIQAPQRSVIHHHG